MRICSKDICGFQSEGFPNTKFISIYTGQHPLVAGEPLLGASKSSHPWGQRAGPDQPALGGRRSFRPSGIKGLCPPH